MLGSFLPEQRIRKKRQAPHLCAVLRQGCGAFLFRGSDSASGVRPGARIALRLSGASQRLSAALFAKKRGEKHGQELCLLQRGRVG